MGTVGLQLEVAKPCRKVAYNGKVEKPEVEVNLLSQNCAGCGVIVWFAVSS